MPKIKIIQIIPQLELGGAERLVADITRGIDSDKFEVKIISLYSLGALGESLRQKGYSVYFVGAKHKLGIFSVYKIYKILKREKPDIVHTHLFGADVWGGLAAMLAHVPNLISTEHNLNYNENGWKFVLKRLILGRFKKIITISNAVSNYLEKVFNIKSEKLIQIYNGIHVSKYNNIRRLEKSGNEKFIIGSLGRLSKQKGYDVLISALEKLDFEYECRIAGMGDLREELQDLINFKGLESKIKLIGKVEEVEKFYRDLDVYIQPSRWEGLCLAVLEAGASSLPILASSVDGLLEIIDDSQNGFLFDLNNEVQIIEHLNYVKNHKLEASILGEKLKQKVIEKFTIEKMINEYEKVYLNLIK